MNKKRKLILTYSKDVIKKKDKFLLHLFSFKTPISKYSLNSFKYFYYKIINHYNNVDTIFSI